MYSVLLKMCQSFQLHAPYSEVFSVWNSYAVHILIQIKEQGGLRPIRLNN